MPGVAGRKAVVKVMGAGVAFTTEACTNLGDGLNYQIAAVAKRVWDPTAAVSVFYNGVLQPAANYRLNRVIGKITFLVAPGGLVVTVTGTYRPVSNAVRATAFNWSLEATIAEDNDWDNIVTSNGFSNKIQTMKDISGSVSAKFSADVYFRDALLNDTLVVLEFYADRSLAHDIICWAVLDKVDMQAALDSVQTREVSFRGDIDIDGNVAGI
jgi:hypothetical protein